MVTKRLKVYAFIDSQNLNLGISKDIFQRGKLIYSGWNLDYTKFRKYLKNKFYAEKAFMFIGYIPKYKAMYENLVSSGFKLIYKQVVLNKRGNYKGNIDAELVLHSCKLKYDEYDQAVIVSGDGDFLCIYEFLKREGKLKNIIIPNSKSESSLLRKMGEYKTYLEYERERLQYRKKMGGVHTLPLR